MAVINIPWLLIFTDFSPDCVIKNNLWWHYLLRGVKVDGYSAVAPKNSNQEKKLTVLVEDKKYYDILMDSVVTIDLGKL